jgi:hypothetical protein
MSGRKGKKSTPALSSATPGTVIAHPSTTAHSECTCASEMQALRDLMAQFFQSITSRLNSSDHAVNSITQPLIQHVADLAKGTKILTNKVLSLEEQGTATGDISKNLNLNELKAKTQTRFALIETSISHLRSSLTEKLHALETLSSSAADKLDPIPSTAHSKIISSIQAGLRNLNKRIRKNNIVVHGIPNSTQDCVEQANTFFQTHLKLKLPIQYAYRLGSSALERNPPLLIAFPSLHYKLEIFKKCKLLAGSKFSIQDDLSVEEREERSRKLPVYRKYKNQKKKVVFCGSDLYVDGKIVNC